jgi:hypothetical protein
VLAVVDDAMDSIRWTRRAALLAAAIILTSIASAKADEPCERPCTHVEDCPKVSCECTHDTASGVALCDTEKTHCCGSAGAACKRFCEVYHQKWTGKLTPETSAPETPPHDSPATQANDAAGSTTACSEPCQEPKDCHTISCQCVHGTAPDVAACNAKTHCCGSARVVCEHFCGAKKDKWTGKLVEQAPPDEGSMLGGPDEDLEPDDSDDGLDD